MHRYLTATTLFLLLLVLPVFAAPESISDKSLLSAVTGGDQAEYDSAIEYIKINRPPALPSLLKEEFLDDDDEDLRGRIISAMKEYPMQENSQLWIEMIRAAKEKNTEIMLIELLSSSKTASFTVPVAEKLVVPRIEVREKAAIMLKKYGDDRMFPVILSLGNSKNPIDRIYFLEALKHLYDMRFQKLAISMLDDENKSVRIYAIRCVNSNEVKEALPSLRRLAAKDDNNETRKMAVESLVSFKDTQSGPMLTAMLKDQDSVMRQTALDALRELKYYSAAVPVSEMLLREEERGIKLAALDTLISFKKAGNVSGIKHIIKSDNDPMMRTKAVYTLGEVGEENSSIDVLKEALQDEDYRVRGEACSALGSFRKGSNASEILISRIKSDKSRYVRSAALYSIVKINDSKNVIKLFDIYATEEDRVFRELLRDTLRNSIQKYIR